MNSLCINPNKTLPGNVTIFSKTVNQEHGIANLFFRSLCLVQQKDNEILIFASVFNLLQYFGDLSSGDSGFT
jgi:hypothetical protein